MEPGALREMPDRVLKQSYTVPCPSGFRDAVEALAAARGVNVGDIARSILLVIPPEVVAAVPDPGGPGKDDRETVVLKSGPGAGRPWRRKPRLQVRLSPGYDVVTVRKALSLALSLQNGTRSFRIADRREDEARASAARREREAEVERRLEEQTERLKTVVSNLSFIPLAAGVRTRDEALHVLGFPPGSVPDARAIRARFRILATIHHPDSEFGSHERMSQLNAAVDVLRR